MKALVPMFPSFPVFVATLVLFIPNQCCRKTGRIKKREPEREIEIERERNKCCVVTGHKALIWEC